MHRGLFPYAHGLRWWTGCRLALLCLVSWSGPARADPPRVALVIGTSAYPGEFPPTSLKDAGLVARALSQAGFAVTAAGDVDKGRLETVLDGFLAETANAGPDATIVVYLAGYSLQYAGSVSFVPVGATLARDADIPGETVSITAVMRRLEAMPAKARVFLLDLARATPFSMAGASVAGGLPLIQPTKGTIVAMNAAPGTVAVPDATLYGVYARALSEVITTTSLPVSAQLERVRMRVGMLSNGANVPWNGGTIEGEISLGVPEGSPPVSLKPALDGKAAATPAETAYVAALARDTLDDNTAFLAAYPDDALAARVRSMVAVRREALLWNETLRADLDRAYWTYMRRYRRGPHVADAKRRLAMLRAIPEPPLRFDIYFYTSAALPQPWEAALIERPPIALDDPAWRQTPVTDAGLVAPNPAFYEDLPPPPLVPAGAVPIADPVTKRVGGVITQPDVPSIGSIVDEIRLAPDGSWIASTLADGKPLFTTRSSTANGSWTALQTGLDGAVFSRTTITHDKGTTTILQTGPDGGILTKAVTRGDHASGQSTLLTNGGNQTIAIVQVDTRGVTTAKRGLVAAHDLVLVPGTMPGEKPSVVPSRPAVALPLSPLLLRPLEPQPPPPLAMPAIVAITPLISLSPPKVPGVSVPGKVAPASPPSAASASTDTKPETAARPSVDLPRIAPLPPRRIEAPLRPKAVLSRKAIPGRKPR